MYFIPLIVDKFERCVNPVLIFLMVPDFFDLLSMTNLTYGVIKKYRILR